MTAVEQSVSGRTLLGDASRAAEQGDLDRALGLLDDAIRSASETSDHELLGDCATLGAELQVLAVSGSELARAIDLVRVAQPPATAVSADAMQQPVERSRAFWLAEALVAITVVVFTVVGMWAIGPALDRPHDLQAAEGALVGLPLLLGAVPLLMLALAADRSPRGVGWALVAVGTPLASFFLLGPLHDDHGGATEVLLGVGAVLLLVLAVALGWSPKAVRRVLWLVGAALSLCLLAWALHRLKAGFPLYECIGGATAICPPIGGLLFLYSTTPTEPRALQ